MSTRTAPTPPPPVHEPPNWLRAGVSAFVAADESVGLDTHNGPSTIVWPLGATGEPGTRADRECDRCGADVPKSDQLVMTVVQAPLHMVLCGGLCTDCHAREGVPA